MNRSENRLLTATVLGIAFGFAFLAIIGALFGVIDPKTSVLFVPIVLMLATVFAAVRRSSR
ncbi:hypothetical protein [Parvularcula maris]|uniref:Uncharacterized protein n=1 Tax=Parvularcula maris TaxID=2965077 RepID=A0A9X2RGU2_9PROT|nr:hypothetical protein [Parvularcula maris]MCQ8184199.1 hypothetical protein [Parvularcula maris]